MTVNQLLLLLGVACIGWLFFRTIRSRGYELDTRMAGHRAGYLAGVAVIAVKTSIVKSVDEIRLDSQAGVDLVMDHDASDNYAEYLLLSIAGIAGEAYWNGGNIRYYENLHKWQSIVTTAILLQRENLDNLSWIDLGMDPSLPPIKLPDSVPMDQRSAMMITATYHHAKCLLEMNEQVFERIVTSLLKERTLSKKEVHRLLGLFLK